MDSRTKLNKAWTTYMPLLIKAVQATDGPVMELGAGPFSTPLLHWLCRGRRVMSYENHAYYYELAKGYQSRYHSIRLVTEWSEVVTTRHWGVIFIDHDGDRGGDAVRFKDNADFIVLHDSEEPIYNWHKLDGQFKYRFDWKECRPWTTVVSNFRELVI